MKIFGRGFDSRRLHHRKVFEPSSEPGSPSSSRRVQDLEIRFGYVVRQGDRKAVCSESVRLFVCRYFWSFLWSCYLRSVSTDALGSYGDADGGGNRHLRKTRPSLSVSAAPLKASEDLT